MKRILLLASALLLFSLAGFAQTSISPVKLNYGGFYHTLSDSLNPFRFYLRFYTDGTVIGTSTAGNPRNLIPWFKKDHRYVSSGTYTLTDSTIKFSLVAKEGVVQHQGRLVGNDRLWLNVKSLINKYEGKEEYFFWKVDGLK